MKPIASRRATWLRVVHQLGTKLGRPPSTAEIAREAGRSHNAASAMTVLARRDGQLVGDARPNVMAPRPIRLTPAALVELGIPLVVYLAWPGGDRARGAAIASWLGDLGLWAVSPYLGSSTTPAGSERGRLDAAVALARRADAVLVWTDPLLIGHPDVAAALAAGVPVGLVRPGDEAGISTAADLWRPPLLVLPPAGLPTGR